MVPPFISTNTLFSYRKLQKFYTISFFIKVYISFIYLIKSSLIYFYSAVLLYLLFLQCTLQYNKNLFKSYSLVFIKSIMALFYVFRLRSFLYFFRQVNAIINRHTQVYLAGLNSSNRVIIITDAGRFKGVKDRKHTGIIGTLLT